MDVTPQAVSSECHTAKQSSPSWGILQSWAVNTLRGVWDVRSGIRFSLAGWTSTGSGWEFLCSILWCGPALWVSPAHSALKPSCCDSAYPGALPLQKNVGRGRRREGGMNLLDGITQGLFLGVPLPSFVSIEFRELVVFVSVIQWQLSRLLPGGVSFLWDRQEMKYWCRSTSCAALVADFSL